MSDPFVGEIRIVPFNFAPKNWALCNGQLLPLSQNIALFSLLGTTYGGNGSSTFALPDLQGSIPMHQAQGPGLSWRQLGEKAGDDSVTLTEAQMPAHTHTIQATAAAGTVNSPSNAIWAEPRYGRSTEKAYAASAGVTMSPAALSTAGSSQPHNNLPPYLVVNFIIALQGIFPPRQ
ncbi:phage tail protein [Cryobacterium glaciale]|uniref:Phage tail protein n=1 Tax=Cryobacterium glaciale TaxID=1259145 RepID=A0A4R8V2H5_9MICO|nr:tail fiber protein [Cryobacterium glaciale]TFB75339.1 phage tail protein [Cryobacterium glaciale]